MQSMRGSLRLTRSLVAGSLVALGVAGVLAGCQRKEAEAPELPVQTVSGFLEIAGVLDRRGEQGAVFEVSPETGDLVAFVFDPKSALGLRLLSQCVQNMPCLVEGVRARPLDSQAPATKVLTELGFSVSPSAWLGMIDAGPARVESALEEPEKQVKTRFGVVAVQEGDSSVVLNGQTVLPAQEEPVSIVRNAPVGAEDVLLLQSGSGTACPALFQMLVVSAQGVQVSPKFGSCSDRVFAVVEEKPNQAPRLSIRMLGFAGPFEPEEEQRKAAQKLVEFVYQRGALTQDGKPVTSQ
ncbi:hypothetical protein ATF69_4277 [Acidovorax delafieldii]|uniref:Lipoprotein n=1 Tax=Acidovorax delafieldii TaxID=47920 RepID=A0A561XAQ6_ACIDE|nr:hypothetical protein [Acidovorax delafieldii]TWG33203.1 hypothetical protein ATF69_4277 [Acidovorax delafieldii]